MSVTFARGFRAGGVAAGMKPSGRPDLALLVADEPASAAGLLTANAFAAAPVRLSRTRLARGRAQAVVVNSGQANAGTGLRGDHDAGRVTQAVAGSLGVDEALVLACSTGVIGEPLHMEELLAAVPALVGSLDEDGGQAFAEAIMTVDTRTKQATAERGRYRVGGAAKGVVMIAPDLRLATMLGFLTTDAPIPGAQAGALLDELVEPVFGSLTIDGCSSTNDCVLLLASGAAGGDLVLPETDAWRDIGEAVGEVARSLVAQLADDAPGARHAMLVEVSGAATDRDARVVARAIAGSPLVKAAMFGRDPRAGRILQAIGATGVEFLPQAVHVRIAQIPVIASGEVLMAPGTGLDEVRAALEERDVVITVSLGNGPGAGRAVGADLSYEYVRINAEYTT